MTNKKNLFKNISIFLCLVPMLLLSFLCLVPKKDLHVSAADQVITPYSFTGSNITTVATLHTPSGGYDQTSVINVGISFTYSNGTLSYTVTGAYLNHNWTSVANINVTRSLSTAYSDYYKINISNNYYIELDVNRSSSFITQNINRVQFSCVQDGGGYFNFITYYDTDNNYIRFGFYHWSGVSSTNAFIPFNFVDRTYYLNLLSIGNNTYYDAGYTDGYNAGVVDGANGGYTDGYNAGQTIGYQNGYSDGVAHGGNYTFMGLIGAVIDAPVSAFTSLLNFELLGVNILGFITGLLTLALIVFIIKLCMGGK